MTIFKHWLPLAAAVTVVSGMIYGTVQQNYRQSANDPQIQIAEDLALQLSSGQQQFNLPTAKVDLAKSLSPVIIILDDTGKELYSSGVLDGATPVPPKGVFEFTKANGEDRVTWEPKRGVREALVVVYFNNVTTKRTGYVIAAKSLKEVEIREQKLEMMVGAGWLAALLGSFLLQWWLRPKPSVNTNVA